MAFNPYQLVDLLRLAKEHINYCLYIEEYPQSNGKKNYDVGDPIDRFYKNLHNISFDEALLITGSLVSKDKRVISFPNWSKYMTKRSVQIETLIKKYDKTGLKTARDQVIAHSDSGNQTNDFVSDRKQGMVNPYLVNNLSRIIDELIEEFDNFTRSEGKDVHAPQAFNNQDAIKEIAAVMQACPPKLTNGFVI